MSSLAVKFEMWDVFFWYNRGLRTGIGTETFVLKLEPIQKQPRQVKLFIIVILTVVQSK